METYVISYDLNSPGQNYKGFWERLERMGAVRTQLSVWILRSFHTAVQLREILRADLDKNDRLFVYASRSNWASIGAMNNATIQQDIG